PVWLRQPPGKVGGVRSLCASLPPGAMVRSHSPLARLTSASSQPRVTSPVEGGSGTTSYSGPTPVEAHAPSPHVGSVALHSHGGLIPPGPDRSQDRRPGPDHNRG